MGMQIVGCKKHSRRRLENYGTSQFSWANNIHCSGIGREIEREEHGELIEPRD